VRPEGSRAQRRPHASPGERDESMKPSKFARRLWQSLVGRPAARPRRAVRMLFEPLESRLLLSADPVGIAAAGPNDGELQRSMVTSIVVQFDQDVGTVAPSILFLHNTTARADVDLGRAAFRYDAPTRKAIWTFPNETGGSLPNGHYIGIVDASAVSWVSGRSLDANGDGVAGDSRVFQFHRLAGDVNGDRVNNLTDFLEFEKTFQKSAGQAGFDRRFDFDADGDVDIPDALAYRETYFLGPLAPAVQAEAGLYRDTAPGGSVDANSITADPTVRGRLTPRQAVTTVLAGFAGTPVDQYRNITQLVGLDGAFLLRPFDLDQILGRPLADGDHVLRVLAADAAASLVGAADVAFRLDRKPPEVSSATPGEAEIVRATRLDLTISFSEAVTGVQAGHLVLRGDAAANATVSDAVQIGPALWQFAITGLQDGRLDIALAPPGATITDLAGNALLRQDWTYEVNTRPQLGVDVPVLLAGDGPRSIAVELAEAAVTPREITVGVDDPAIAAVSATSLSIPAGETKLTFGIEGLKPGTTTLRFTGDAISPTVVTVVVTSWEPIGPDHGGVLALQRDAFDADVLYAGTFYGGLYKSADGGASWRHVDAPFSGLNIQAIAVDPTQEGIVYVGTYLAGVFKSVDGGESWSAINDGLDGLTVSAIAIDPFDAGRLIIATSEGPFVSGDGGASWEKLRTGDTDYVAVSVAFDPEREGHIYLGTVGRGVLQSDDGGMTWARLAGIGDYSVISLRFDGAGKALYATSFGGVFELSLDSAATEWEDITYELTPGRINDVIADAATPDRLIAMTNDGVFELRRGETAPAWTPIGYFAGRTALTEPSGGGLLVATLDKGLLATDDGGDTWRTRNDGLQNAFVGAMGVVLTGAHTTVLAASEVGVFVSSDGGVTWTNDGGFVNTVFEIAPSPVEANVVFVGTERKGVWKSEDYGATWMQKSAGLVPPQVRVLARAPGASNVLYAGADSGLYMSRDGGTSWFLATQSPITHIMSIAFDPVRPEIAFFGTGDGKVFCTPDDGITFVESGSGLPAAAVSHLAIAAFQEVFPIIYAVTGDGRLFVSTDDARSWFEFPTGTTDRVVALAVDRANPGTVYIGTAGGGVLKTVDYGANWVARNTGLDAPYVLALTLGASDGVLYASTSGGILKSSDGAATWTSAGDGLPDQALVVRLAPDPRNAGVVVAQTADQGLFRTQDGGETWSAVDTGREPASIESFAVDPTDSSRLYLGTELDGVFASIDAGVSWRAASDGMTMFVRGIAIDPTQPSVMYASSLTGGVFKSVDGGESWRNVGLVNRACYDVSVDPSNPGTVYVGTAGGVARSTDGGETWVILGQRTAVVGSMMNDPRDPAILYVTGPNGGLYRSTDGGEVFEDINGGLPPRNVTAMAIDTSSETLYSALEGEGVYKSADDGRTWTKVLDIGWLGRDVTVLLVDQQNGDLYAGTDGAGILKSTDGGAQWTFDSEGLENLEIRCLVIDASASGKLYAATAAGVFTSSDAGGLWTKASDGLGDRPIEALTLDPGQTGVLYAATDDGVFKTVDGGAHWARSNEGLGQSKVKAFLVDPFDSQTVYAGTSGDGVYKSTDSGETWLPVIDGLGSGLIRALAASPTPGTVFAGTIGSGVEKTMNGGTTWSGGNGGVALPVILAIGLSDEAPGLVYAGTGDIGVLKSTDGGRTWKAVNNGLEDLQVFCLAVDPEDPDIVYAGTRTQGVFYTEDGGASWKALSKPGLFMRFVVSLAVDPLDRGVIYAGTEGGGAFRLVRV
jgi:photosystem II stability/assembly factor-like uncharacterized protein